MFYLTIDIKCPRNRVFFQKIVFSLFNHKTKPGHNPNPQFLHSSYSPSSNIHAEVQKT